MATWGHGGWRAPAWQAAGGGFCLVLVRSGRPGAGSKGLAAGPSPCDRSPRVQGCTRSFPPSPWSGQGCPSCLLGARSFLEPWAAQLELSPFPFLTQSFCQDVLLPAPQGSSLAPRPLSGVGVSPCPGPVPSVFWSKDHNLVCLQALSQVVFLLQRSGPGSIRGLQWARKGKEKYPSDAEITGGRPTYQASRVRRVSVGFQPGLRCPLYKDLHLGLQHSAGHTGAGRGGAGFLPLQLTWNPHGPPGSEQRPSGRRARWGFLTLLLLRCLFPDFRVSFSELRNQS